MAKKPKALPPPGADSGGALKHNPFAGLGLDRSALPTGNLPEATPAPATPAQATPAPRPERTRLILRRETKHRGGKTVVIVRGLAAWQAADVDTLAKQLKQKLGCGGSVEHDSGEPEIVIQGDQPAKVTELLRAQGFRVDGVTR